MADIIKVLNLIYDLVIVALGIWAYTKIKRNVLIECVALGFLLFAVSWALIIDGITDPVIIIPIRTIGYIAVIIGMAFQIKGEMIHNPLIKHIHKPENKRK